MTNVFNIRPRTEPLLNEVARNYELWREATGNDAPPWASLSTDEKEEVVGNVYGDIMADLSALGAL